MSTTQQPFSTLLATTSVRSVLVYRASLLREFIMTGFFSHAPSVGAPSGAPTEGAPHTSEDAITAFVHQRNVSQDDGVFLRSLPTSFWDVFTQDSFEQELNKIDEALQKQPLFPLTLARTLSQRNLETIGTWVRTVAGDGVLLDVAVDTSVVAGCRFIWHDTLHDFSFARSVDEHKKELAEMSANEIK